VAVFGVIALLLAAGAVYINLNPSNETVTDKVRQLMELPVSYFFLMLKMATRY